MTVTRQNLINICDDFIIGKVDKAFIKNFASHALVIDAIEWGEDEIITETIFDWDNEDIGFEINKINIQLWKDRLSTGRDDLVSYNSWNSHIISQKQICLAHDSEWKPVNKKLKVSVSVNLDTDPVNGLRIPGEKGSTGWFIWSGDYSEREDFFKPMCAEHLLQKRPDIVKYLGLDIGFRFLADRSDYGEVWFDEKIAGT
ncbi:immunity protein Imm33 domain-containing protein [Dyadobacter psychrotolerans]|uniref:Imm33-like domain-containing protein n=1 Tax=Dyadobacter psychrotolerans TaxID=2541721 RepID=A0A4R5DSC3_9BACT|nr:hypothetical protein [Dyadobacter psychrotolerans]TDE15244.1 hypothetical protein E0F88_12020 [Dyadobacter psychrotolerans]